MMTSDMRPVAKVALCCLLYYSGGVRLFRRISKRNGKGRGIKILAYHDIGAQSFFNLQIPEKVFRSHIKYLVDGKYNLICLEEAAELLKGKEPIPEDTVVITFDDGYRSIYEHVLPAVRRYGIPVTVFISTGPVDKRHPLFVDAIAYAFEKTKKERLDLKRWGLGEYSIANQGLKEMAGLEINDFSKNLKTVDRMRFLEYIFEKLDVDLDSPELRDKMLTWDEVRESKSKGISFGAHTVTHPSLSRISPDEAGSEIYSSKKMIEEKLNLDIKGFAYPYGLEKDVNQTVRKIVEENGFMYACTLNDGINNIGDDLFTLKRICITNPLRARPLWIFSRAVFAIELSGFLKLFRFNDKTEIKVKDSERINILFVIDQLAGGGAGTEKHLLNLVKHINKDRFNCVICCFECKDEIFKKKIQEQGIIFRELDLSRIYSYKAPIAAFRLRKIIKENKIDIVQTFHFKSDTFGVTVSRLSGISKIISSRRDTGDLKKPRQVFLNEFTNYFVNRFIMVCNAVGEKFHRNEGISRDKMTTIYNGVDLTIFNEAPDNILIDRLREEIGIKKDDFVIGTTAIFRPEKAYHIFFAGIEKAMPFIRNLKVLVLGDGLLKKYFENHCRKGPLKDVVKFMGYVEKPHNYVSLMDIFCLVPNTNEGFSNSILEAMAMGKPVIATNIGGNAEAVIHNKTGFIIPPDNSEALSDGILMLYRDSAMRQNMGEKSRKRIEELFSQEQMIKNYEDLYEEVFRPLNKISRPPRL